MFPSTFPSARVSGRIAGIAPIVLILALGGCSKPLLEGPQITKLPLGFMMDANASAAGALFPDLEETGEFGYFCLGEDDEHSSIMINTYAGSATREQVRSAYEAERERRGYQKFEPMETVTIDGRAGWGWFTTQTVKGRLSSRKLVVVLPDDEDGITYVVEYYSSQEKFWDPASMNETLSSFRVKKAGVSYGKIGVFLVLALGFFGVMNRLKQERPA